MDDPIDLTDDLPAQSSHHAQLLQAVEQELQDLEVTLQGLLERQGQLKEEQKRLQRLVHDEQCGPKGDWAHDSFPWDQQVQQLMHGVFGLRAFRPLQHEVINATLSGADVLCLLPSGGGKSLCYQLPALMQQRGVTLVISPLLALIQDQVLGLEGLGVHAAALTSLSSKEEVNKIYADLTAAAAAGGGKGSNSSRPPKKKPKLSGKGGADDEGGAEQHVAGVAGAAAAGDSGGLRLVYVTPEKVVKSKRFMAKLEKLYQAGQLLRIAIDEAHCCSQWGNDFRPDYKKLGILRQQFPKTPILALTATATQQVVRDLQSILQVEGCEVFRASVDRPNLSYVLRPKPAGAGEAAEDICEWIRTHFPNGESGIVYCLTRKDAESLAEVLCSGGVASRYYHADMDPHLRLQAHKEWSKGEAQVMVATIAFGMGINKPDVRFVVHACLSKSLENYYQESSRAGRDGQPATCCLTYRFSDVLRQASVVCVEPGWQQHLWGMLRFAAATSHPGSSSCCRRATLQAHFGETPRCCSTNTSSSISSGVAACDLCRAAAAVGGVCAEQKDWTEAVVWILWLLKSLKKATLTQLLDALRSKKHQIPGSGGPPVPSPVPSREAGEWLVEQMLLEGLLSLEFGFTAYATNTYLVLAQKGLSRLEGGGKGPTYLWTMADPLEDFSRPAHANAQSAATKPAAGGGHSHPHAGAANGRSTTATAAAGASSGAASASVPAPAAGGAGRTSPGLTLGQQQFLAKLVGVLAGLADRLGLYPHNLLSQEQLEEMVLHPPGSLEDLEEMLGEARVTLVGEGILQAVQEWRGEMGKAVSTQDQQQQQGRQQQTRQQEAEGKGGRSRQRQQQQEEDGAERGQGAGEDQEHERSQVEHRHKRTSAGRKGTVHVSDTSDEDEDFVPLKRRQGQV